MVLVTIVIKNLIHHNAASELVTIVNGNSSTYAI